MGEVSTTVVLVSKLNTAYTTEIHKFSYLFPIVSVDMSESLNIVKY